MPAAALLPGASFLCSLSLCGKGRGSIRCSTARFGARLPRARRIRARGRARRPCSIHPSPACGAVEDDELGGHGGGRRRAREAVGWARQRHVVGPAEDGGASGILWIQRIPGSTPFPRPPAGAPLQPVLRHPTTGKGWRGISRPPLWVV
jgi:hypothetical protein